MVRFRFGFKGFWKRSVQFLLLVLKKIKTKPNRLRVGLVRFISAMMGMGRHWLVAKLRAKETVWKLRRQRPRGSCGDGNGIRMEVEATTLVFAMCTAEAIALRGSWGDGDGVYICVEAEAIASTWKLRQQWDSGLNRFEPNRTEWFDSVSSRV